MATRLKLTPHSDHFVSQPVVSLLTQTLWTGRIKAFLAVLDGLQEKGWRPAVITLVDSSLAQPWFLDRGHHQGEEAVGEQYEHRMPGGPYTPPEIAAYAHQRVLKGLTRLYHGA